MNSIPDGAVYEADLGGGVALYDVSHLLPKHPTKRYRDRGQPTEQYVHHSGKLGRPGYAGMYNSTRYTVRARGWPGFAYTTWIPYLPVFDPAGNVCVLRGNPDTVRTYHAGSGPNTRAVSHCLQGNTTRRPLSNAQLKCLKQLLPWYIDRLQVHTYGHCEAPADGHRKATCPGTHAQTFIHGLRTTLG